MNLRKRIYTEGVLPHAEVTVVANKAGFARDFFNSIICFWHASSAANLSHPVSAMSGANLKMVSARCPDSIVLSQTASRLVKAGFVRVADDSLGTQISKIASYSTKVTFCGLARADAWFDMIRTPGPIRSMGLRRDALAKQMSGAPQVANSRFASTWPGGCGWVLAHQGAICLDNKSPSGGLYFHDLTPTGSSATPRIRAGATAISTNPVATS